MLLKTTRLVVILLCLSYFTGLICFILTDLIYFDANHGDTSDNLISVYFSDISNYECVIKLTYFAFTTLSTVGLGDIYPNGNAERVFGSFFMLFGVLLTSIIMDNFSSMLNELRHFNKNYEESKELNLFVGTMRKFNGGIQINPQF